MDVVVFFHGLGNQMSQYSFFLQKKSVKKATSAILFCNHHNGFELDKAFHISWKERLRDKALYVLFRMLLTDRLRFISKPVQLLLNLFSCRIIKEGYDYTFKQQYLAPSKGITFYLGGWHNERYFNDVTHELSDQFRFKEISGTENAAYEKKIRETNSVSIHIRRGDYLNSANIDLFGDVCNEAYFSKAIGITETKVSDAHYFIFSNDIPWAKANLILKNVTYVTGNTGKDAWNDMYLMSLCKHNIIANSTFSWWAAWLNKNQSKIVVAPSRFLKNDPSSDVYPESWFKLSDY